MSIIKSGVKHTWKLTSNAEEVWRGINGVIAIYKPTGNSVKQVRNTLILHLCRDFNELDVRPPSTYVAIEGETNKRMHVEVISSYADHELVVGPRYQDKDFKASPAHFLSKDMSGIMLFGINGGTNMVSRIAKANPTRFYKVKGLLGQVTDNYFITGKIVEKTTYKHVKRHHMDMICGAIQAAHQKTMFDVCGVDIQSQTAYDLAVQGPIRPTESRIPMLYSLKCIEFKPPEFTLEIICLNEDEMFLKSLVHGIGLQLRSSATCTQMQCCQYGIFNLDITLLKRDWNLRSMTENMNKIRQILGKNKFVFKSTDPIYHEYKKNFDT